MICAVSISETESETQLSILCIYHIHIFFHPDFTVGFGVTPNLQNLLAGYTAGRELHPALKIVIQLRTIIIFDIISVNKKFFLVYPNTIICKQVNTGYFLISFCLGNSGFPLCYRLPGNANYISYIFLRHVFHFSKCYQIVMKHRFFSLSLFRAPPI